MNGKQAAIYARVSSDQQAEAGTIGSQLSALKERVTQDGSRLPEEMLFVDEGYSGATLVRPALERLRDLVASGAVDRIYVHSPDRLARKYAYQILLVDEFHRAGVEVVFLNRELGRSPEDDLLLQVQGMVAEYERAKILERSRRGKRHAAHRGIVNVLSTAPYGYRYIGKHESGGAGARLEIALEEARVVQQIFDWIGRERLSIGEVRRKLGQSGEKTRSGKTWWDRTSIWGILKNPAYKGHAAFGKTRIGPMRPRLRAQRNGSEPPRKAYSVYDAPKEDWITIPVPAIVSEEIFDTVQEQLRENRTRARERKRGARYLLQGVLTCRRCGYAYYGKAISLATRRGNHRDYAYYRCIGTDAYRFGGQRICQNKQVRTDLLDQAVWKEVHQLLEDPQRLETEYRRRKTGAGKTPRGYDPIQLDAQIGRLRKGIARIIDGYAEGLLTKEEFEPRIKTAKERLARLQEQAKALAEEASLEAELKLVVGKLDEFAAQVKDGLGKQDWLGRREIIRTLVKRVEVEENQVNVVFRVGSRPFVLGPGRGPLQHCWRRDHSPLRRSPLGLHDHSVLHHPSFEPASDQLQHLPVRDPLPYRFHQQLMVDAVEVLLDVGIHHPVMPGVARFPDRLQRILSASPRTESITALLEIRLEDRLDHELYRRLHHPVSYRRYPQRPLLPIRLRDVLPSHRWRPVFPSLQVLLDSFQ
jgi:site-specific DNA recombinase